MPWVGLRCVIVVFPDHTHLLLKGNKQNIALLHTGRKGTHVITKNDTVQDTKTSKQRHINSRYMKEGGRKYHPGPVPYYCGK